MNRSLRSSLLALLFTVGGGSSLRAQAATEKSADEPTVFTDPAKAAAAADASGPAKPARPRRERAISDDLAATLAVGMPKYNPPKPVVKKMAPDAGLVDARDADKPKNGIVRLPDYVVRETPPPVFAKKDLGTTESNTDVAYKIHPGLNAGPLASLNRPIGLAMYREQERLENMADLAEEARTARRAGDKATADYITRQSQQTYIQRDDNLNSYTTGPK